MLAGGVYTTAGGHVDIVGSLLVEGSVMDTVASGGIYVSWQSKRPHTVALFSCEAEYMGLGDGAKEGLYVILFHMQFAEVLRPA